MHVQPYQRLSRLNHALFIRKQLKQESKSSHQHIDI